MSMTDSNSSVPNHTHAAGKHLYGTCAMQPYYWFEKYKVKKIHTNPAARIHIMKLNKSILVFVLPHFLDFIHTFELCIFNLSKFVWELYVVP